MPFERGDLIWLDFNPQSGHEQAGRRPALVVSPGGYNALSNCILVCPVTTNLAPWPWKTALPPGGAIGGAILVDQLKSVDARARRAEASGEKASDAVMTEVLAKLATLTG